MSKLISVVAVLAALTLAEAATAADKVVLQLHGPAQFEFAGYYAALWQGFYRDLGLSVEIKPGSARGNPPIDAVREVAEGRAQYGTGTVDLAIRIAQGQPLLILAPIFQQSGTGVYYRDDGDYPSPGALAKARVGRLPASDILDIELATAMRAEGIDPDDIKPVPLQPGEAVGALADRNVDVVPGSAWEVPWRAHEKGFAVKSFNPADYRVEFYGDSLFTLQRFAKAEPATVRKFRDASLKGWDYALTHTDEVAARMLSELPRPAGISDAGGYARYQAELAVLLARHPTVSLGHSNPERWRRIEASMLGVGALLRTAEPEDFVYDADAELRTRTDLRAVGILGATLVAGLVMIGLLWRSRRRRAPPGAAVPAEGAGLGAPAAGTTAAANPPAEKPVAAAASTASAVPVPAAGTGRADVATQPATGTPPAAAQPVVVAPPPSGAAAAPAGSAPAAGMAPGGPASAGASREPEPADLNAVVSGLERTIRQRAPRRVSFRLSLLSELWRCRADAETVRKLVLDLTAEATADLKPGGELIVGTRNFAFDAAAVAVTPGAQLGEFARLTVRDNGAGLTEEALAKVFDPAASPSPAAASAAQAMRGIGGFARVESAEGIGTAVHLYFPRTPDPGDTAKPADKPKAAE